ncbi:MAG: FG-GAP-like repeat-containing protein [Isosphaeraceae bacterium]
MTHEPLIHRRWSVFWLASLAGLAVLAATSWWIIGQWRTAVVIRWADREMKLGRFQAVRDRLAWLSACWPGHGGVDYRLGVCEEKLGQIDQAMAAWNRVSPDYLLFAHAGVERGRLLIHRFGRFTEAEELLRSLLRLQPPPPAQARWLLGEILLWEGRTGEFRRVLQDGFRVMPGNNRPAALREIWRLDTVVVSREEVADALKYASEFAPTDHRVWVARANLAIRYGDEAEARQWIDACMKDHADDPAVWLARLNWARLVANPEAAYDALGHIPADRLSADEVRDLLVWFSASRHDPRAEMKALEEQLRHDPDRPAAIARLAVLAQEAGDVRRARELRERKTELERLRQAYRRMLIVDRERFTFLELERLAILAEKLGRWFEAQGWWTLAVEQAADSRQAREGVARSAAKASRSSVPPGKTLAEVLAAAGLTSPQRTAARGESHVPAMLFQDDAASAGLTFTYKSGETFTHQMPATFGGGLALLDYDGDGWLDVYVVQGGDFPPPRTGFQPSGDRLFRNRHDGTFEDVTGKTGLASMAGGYGFGVTVGDYDNDGHPDLFVTRWHGYALYHNRGDGTFEDATAQAGLAGDRDWPTSAAFGDYDNDGDLDLYVCHYLVWDAEHPTLCPNPRGSQKYASCYPPAFPALADHLLRNDGGRFVDVTAQAGINDADGRGLGVLATDFDGDGKIDIFVTDDMSANMFFHNKGNMRFEEEAQIAGLAGNAEGGYQAGMGIACGDLDRDGRPDLAVTNFFGESITFFRNLGGATFADLSLRVGVKAPSRFLLGFGAVFFDGNNDGWLDLATANGHVNDHRPVLPYAMPPKLYAGDSGCRLVDVSDSSGPAWQVTRVARGLVRGDLDNDGKLDLVSVAHNSPLTYLHNKTAEPGHFLTLQLQGARSNRDAIGARVTVRAHGRSQSSWRIGGGSYLSASDPRLHFGLGSSTRVDQVEVVWPSGRVDRHAGLRADTGYLLTEGDIQPRNLSGFPAREK